MRRHAGLTLVELMVVIAVLAVLLALAMPFIASGRESARRAQCSGNLGQVGFAMHAYHQIHDCFPPGHRRFTLGTWQAFLLPHLEQRVLYDAYNFGMPYSDPGNLTVTASRLESLICPSDVPGPTARTPGGITRQNYAANFGNSDLYQGHPSRATPPPIPWEGAPFGDSEASRPPGHPPVCRIQDISDGTSNTFLMAEVVRGQGGDLRGFTWWGQAAGFMTWLAPNSPSPDVQDRPGYCATLFPRTDGINPPCTAADRSHFPSYASRSRHPGGVNVAMADGSVKFIKDAIGLPLWRNLGTTQGNHNGSDSY
jgi:prepilin-type N-terminal cleavage/methylation domain-containing protein/prepilin-type processing-associated H-X9-DG protein